MLPVFKVLDLSYDQFDVFVTSADIMVSRSPKRGSLLVLAGGVDGIIVWKMESHSLVDGSLGNYYYEIIPLLLVQYIRLQFCIHT